MRENEAEYTFSEPPFHVRFADAETGNYLWDEEKARAIPAIGSKHSYGSTRENTRHYEAVGVTGDPFTRIVHVKLRLIEPTR